MLADGNASFTKSLGVELDLADKGLGTRSRRYAMLVDDGVIKVSGSRLEFCAVWSDLDCGLSWFGVI